MAASDVKIFLDRVQSDPSLQARLQSGKGRFVDIGSELGYHFTQDELHAELRGRWGVRQRNDEPDTTTVG